MSADDDEDGGGPPRRKGNKSMRLGFGDALPAGPNAYGGGVRDRLSAFDFNRMDWLVAWRHLRTGDDRPIWVLPVILGALYLMLVGGGLAMYATTLDAGVGPLVEGAFEVPGTDVGPTPLQRFYGAFGGVTLVAGVMVLVFGLLARFFNLLPTIITMSVLLGCMALVVVLSLMSGLEGDLRDKILSQKAHIRVARADGRPFEEYEGLADALAGGDGIAGASPYLEGEIMVRSGLNRQGAILFGIVPERQTTVSNLPSLVREGSYDYLDQPEAIPEPDPFADERGDETPWRLRHLEDQRKKRRKQSRSFEAQTERAKPGTPGTPSKGIEGGKGDEGGAEGPHPGAGIIGSGLLDPGLDDDETGLTPQRAGALLPRKRPKAAPDEALDDFEDFDDGGWEDPAEEEKALRAAGKLPPAPSRASADDAGEGEDADVDDDGSEDAFDGGDDFGDDGWEDPAVEEQKLRDAGVLPDITDLPDPLPDPLPDDGADDGADEAGEDDGGGVGGKTAGGGINISSAESPGESSPSMTFPLLVGRELSMELGVRVGAQVQLITPIGRMTPAGRMPGQLVTKVAGVFFSGMYEYDRKNVYAPLPVVQRFLLVGDRVSGIEVKLIDVEAIDDGKAVVEAIVAERGRDDLIVEDWRDLNRNLFSAMFLEKVAMFIALLFVVLVASFGILASNLMSVMEKAKEIAILKAMGTADAGIMRVFIAEGLCMGLLGSFGGIAMGLGLCWALDRFGLPLNENVYYIEKLPVVVNPVEVALVGGAALVIVCFSSLYPALVAARLRPVDGLRHAEA